MIMIVYPVSYTTQRWWYSLGAMSSAKGPVRKSYSALRLSIFEEEPQHDILKLAVNGFSFYALSENSVVNKPFE